MSNNNSRLSRRVFLKHSMTMVFLSGMANYGYSLPAEDKTLITKRRKLDKASPMIPPVPAILLTVNGLDEGPDEISVAWTFVINSNPPQIGISVHRDHVSRTLIQKHKQFVLNVPTAGMAESFDIVDMNSKKIADKFALTNLNRGKAVKINAPTIEESPIQVECQVFKEVKVEPVRTLFLAKVVATTIHDHVCDKNGRLKVSEVPFFGMTVGSGEFYTMGKMVGHIGQSVDRDDIEY